MGIRKTQGRHLLDSKPDFICIVSKIRKASLVFQHIKYVKVMMLQGRKTSNTCILYEWKGKMSYTVHGFITNLFQFLAEHYYKQNSASPASPNQPLLYYITRSWERNWNQVINRYLIETLFITVSNLNGKIKAYCRPCHLSSGTLR